MMDLWPRHTSMSQCLTTLEFMSLTEGFLPLAGVWNLAIFVPRNFIGPQNAVRCMGIDLVIVELPLSH